MVQMETQHSVGVPTCRDFPRFVFVSEKSRPESEVADDVQAKVDVFGKKTPYEQIFKNVFRKDSWRQIHILCANIVKFG